MKAIILRCVVLIVILSANTVDSNAGPIPIGTFATVEGAVTISRDTITEPRAVKYQDDIILRDVIQTQRHAYAKALFEDDSLLSVPEQSRIEISEYVYDPAHGVRSTIVQLTEGAVRALVGRIFRGTGSRFEVHTANAVAAARGTYFVVWLEPEGKSTGLANIGDKGDVAFTAAGETVVVKPGFYSFAHPGVVPAAPVRIDGLVPAVNKAIETTDLPNTVLDESPKMALRHLPTDLVNPTVVTATGTLSTLTGTILSGSATAVTPTSTLSTVGAGAVSGVTGSLSSTLGSTVTAVTSPLATGGSLLGSTMAAIGSTVATAGAVAPVVSTAGAGVTTTVTSVAPIISPLTTPVTKALSILP